LRIGTRLNISIRSRLCGSGKESDMKMRSYPLRYTFILSYIVDSTFQTGVAQAFGFEEEKLYLLLLEQEKGEITRWVPAETCACRKILNVYAIKEIIERDEIELKDLEVIQDFEWMYLQALSEKGKLS
jgi:hypothetical protein